MIGLDMLADIPDNVVGIMVVAMALLVPIIVTLSRHQQKMAMIFRNSPQGNEDMVGRLTVEVAELRSLVTQQALAIDNLADGQRKVLAALEYSSIQDRISAQQ